MEQDASTPMERRIADAHLIFRAGLDAVRADRLLEDVGWRAWTPRPMPSYQRVVVVAIGKASMGLAGAIEAQLGERLGGGVAIVPHGHPSTFPPGLPRPNRIELLEAGHPVPDVQSVAAARRALRDARACGPDDLLLVLISGGGSALCTDFEDGIMLEDAQATFLLLLESGADIHAVNTVRKHLSRIGGGRLAAAADADILALVVSDVVGDDLSVIASGPTVPDPTTASDAVDVLHRFEIWDSVPAAVRHHLELVRSDASLETPGADAPVFDRVRTEILGTNRRALAAAAAEAERLGYHATIVAHDVTGEASEIGVKMARAALDAAGHRRCLIWGGETAVTVRGSGSGGRNQELALAASIELEEGRTPVVLLSGGTDGRDGPTPAAGACATELTAVHARQEGVDPKDHLERNDSYHFWKRAGGLVVTGPTHTNVMDVQVAIVGTGTSGA
jgi:hydroxypyruvate reductase